MYSIEAQTGLIKDFFTLCENGELKMVHKSRADQRAIKVRKDPNKLARGTRRHTPKVVYKRQRSGKLVAFIKDQIDE